MTSFKKLLILSSLLLSSHCQSPLDRLDQQEAALNRLTARFSDIFDQFDSMVKAEADSKLAVSGLDTILSEELAGDGCPPKYWPCGDGNQCIGDWAVCDGITDCRNGRDESDDVCELLMPPGSLWQGLLNYDRCLGGVFETPKLRIDSAIYPQNSTARIKLRIAYVNEKRSMGSEQYQLNPMDALWDPTTKTMWQYPCVQTACPNMGNRFYSACKMRPGSKRNADCYAWRATYSADTEPCVHVFYWRIK